MIHLGGRTNRYVADELINDYSEATLTGKKPYLLSQDRIQIKGSVSGSYDYERSFELTRINPEYITLRIRPSLPR